MAGDSPDCCNYVLVKNMKLFQSLWMLPLNSDALNFCAKGFSCWLFGGFWLVIFLGVFGFWFFWNSNSSIIAPCGYFLLSLYQAYVVKP